MWGFFLLLLPFVQPSAAEGVKVGILAFQPSAQAQVKWQALEGYLQHQLGQTVHIEVMAYDRLQEAVKRRALDFIFTNPANYVRLASDYGLSPPLCSLIEREGGRPLPVFGGVIFSRADSGIATLADLAGRHIAIPFKDSFGGYQVQAYELVQAGFTPPRDTHLLEVGLPYEQVVEAVLARQAEVGFVRSGVLETMVKDGRIAPQDLRVIHRQHLPDFPYAVSTRLYPEWLFAAMPHVRPDLAARMAAALLNLPHDGELARQIGIWGFAIPQDYASVVEVLRTLRLPPFEHAPAFTLADVWQRYQIVLGVALALAALTLLLLLGLWRKQVRTVALNATIRAQGREIERRSQLERQLLAALDEGVYGVDRHGRCIFINPAGLKLLGYAVEAEVLGQDNHALFHHHRPDHSPYPHQDCPIHQTLHDGQARQVNEEWFIRKDGQFFPVALRVAPIYENGEVQAAVVAFQDISERLDLLERLRHQATHDELTGLLNRRQLFELGEREHARIRRGHGRSAALIMLDVDHFKRINDTFGHLAGDGVLRHLGQQLTAFLRTSDIVARYGGEEFVILLPDTDLDAAVRLAERLRAQLAKSPLRLDGQDLHYTISLGVTALRAEDASLDEAILRADQALYRAKNAGRNRVEAHPA